MSRNPLSSEEIELLRNVKASKRARLVMAHIMDQGSVNTDQLARLGYKHPPRAIRDVKDAGIPLIKTTIKTKDNRRIGEYTFGDVSLVRRGMDGRRVLPKKLKADLIERDGRRCAVCGAELEARYLQIDHRVPYQVTGDMAEELNAKDFMLVCGSCNRAKSWSCEHCENWGKLRDPKVCEACYRARPDKYVHIAMVDARRIDLVWLGEEVKDFDAAEKIAKRSNSPMPKFVKAILHRIARGNKRRSG